MEEDGRKRCILVYCSILTINNYYSPFRFKGANSCNIQYCWLVQINIKYAAGILFYILPCQYCVNGYGNGSARHVKISQNEQAHKCGHFELGIGHIRAISAEIRSYHIMYYICADMWACTVRIMISSAGTLKLRMAITTNTQIRFITLELCPTYIEECLLFRTTCYNEAQCLSLLIMMPQMIELKIAIMFL